ncbi:TPA: glycoside hydrolase family 19 protein [Klebsiella pneumoniae]|uniref:glycoside hydrolase family 19 protein n=1 Tax=Klebsiella pneumoniae complex TaxID=3390273 RepID=UPI000E2B7874|nr:MULTISPECIES: glycoside hydrolase family 19 protein [Klebsiella]HDU4485930.1 glycoside hydrolase family 19 protein [Klebsiella pneumoniae subsp. pneumoniae]MCP6008308.1 glycoside hydrolase family 19 protein [Klebsiella pneumoniae]MCQ0550910.1 glycoside hydrolase family 19 protein [Klebsiella pneumoniae]MCY4734161.1 glycoside hydrolase family 19 protein [Klebsiella pneumoniae]MEC3987439.1 glycoside hydrolase family 19 protein [Klebsiella pneumoniae]
MNQSQFQKAAGISAELAARWYPHITAAIKEFGITTPLDQAMFIAQCGHESTGFTQLVESFNYSVAGLSGFVKAKRITQDQANTLGRKTYEKVLPLERQRAIANLVYSNRYGNKVAGDGWKYRGRGIIGITFLDNYMKCGTALKLDLVSNPEQLEKDINAARSAAWFYTSNSCLKYPGDLVRITQIINGGQNGIDDRRARFLKAKSVLVV